MSNKALLDAVASDFARDSDKESKGVWMVFGKRRYLIARAHRNNVVWQRRMEEEMRPYQWAVERGNLEAIKDVMQAIMQKVYAETILLAIEELPIKAGDVGKPLDYTPEDGVTLFDALPDFWDAVFKFSDAGRNYAKDVGYSPKQVEADTGN